jgi:hypothetical protein
MRFHTYARWGVCFAVLALGAGLLYVPDGSAQDRSAEFEALKKQVEELRKKEVETRQQLEEVQRKLDALQAQPPPVTPAAAPASPLERAVQDLETPQPPPTRPALAARQVGGATLRLIDISADILMAVGGSTVGGETLKCCRAASRSPQQRLCCRPGTISPGPSILLHRRDARPILIMRETRVELEEAFLTTQSLPFGLQVEAGFFLTEFGLINPTQPQARDWVDQPIILSRLLGGRHAPDWHPYRLADTAAVVLGVPCRGAKSQWRDHGELLANDEVFEERAIGGRPFVERRWIVPTWSIAALVNAWNFGHTVTSQLGASTLLDPIAPGQTLVRSFTVPTSK